MLSFRKLPVLNVVMFVHDYRVKPTSFFHLSRPAQGPVESPSQWVAGFFAKSKVAGAIFEQSPPSSADFKNEWSCTFTLAISLLTFFFLPPFFRC